MLVMPFQRINSGYVGRISRVLHAALREENGTRPSAPGECSPLLPPSIRLWQTKNANTLRSVWIANNSNRDAKGISQWELPQHLRESVGMLHSHATAATVAPAASSRLNMALVGVRSARVFSGDRFLHSLWAFAQQF